MTLHPEINIGRLAAEYPLATKVFARHGIDFCCGGGRPLREVCREQDLNADEILEEIGRETAQKTASAERWDHAPLGDLIIHILAVYHRPLDEELPRLESLSREVLEVHRDKQPEMLSELVSVYAGLKADLEDHMGKEEEILFPMIRQGQGMMADGPIAMMEEEHELAGAALKRLRELTNGYQVPEEACNSWRALWQGLAWLEESLHQHIHLENNILFPRALEE